MFENCVILEIVLFQAKEDRTSFECKTDMGEMALIIPNPDEAAAMEKWLKEEKFIHKKA